MHFGGPVLKGTTMIKLVLAVSIALVSQASLGGTLTLTGKESAVVRHMIADDLSIWSRGGESMFKPAGVAVTADHLQRDYEKNEVAGDIAYRRKLILVSGTVRSIDRSIGANYFVMLKGGSNSIMTPRAGMERGFETYLANLDKGQKVTLACQGGGMLMGSAVLAKCRPEASWIEDETTRTMNALPARLAEKESEVPMAILYIVLMASLLPDTSACFSVDPSLHSQCAKDAVRLQKQIKNLSEKRKDLVIETAKRIGVAPTK
jgi:hypothetical protein